MGTIYRYSPYVRETPMDLSHLSAPDAPLAIIGLGYVGLPLAVEFGKHRLREDVGVEVLCLLLSPGP